MRADIVLFSESAARVAVQSGTSGRERSLPQLQLPTGVRPFSEVSAWARDHLGVDLFCLFVLPDEGEQAKRERIVFVCRTIDDSPLTLNDSFMWERVEELHETYPVGAALSWMERYDSGAVENLFARYRWCDELRAWLTGEARISLKRLEHHNVAPYFCLLRIITDEDDYWFKAAGLPEDEEYSISCLVHHLFPKRVPEIVARNEAWKGWIAKHVDGLDLSETVGTESWKITFEALARLQMQSIDSTPTLVGKGASQWTMPQVRHALPEFFGMMAEVMQAQPKEPPERISTADLLDLEKALDRRCVEMIELGIPDTILHGDINPFNVKIAGGMPIFLDWAETSVGNPFLCAEQLKRYFRNLYPSDEASTLLLEEAYSLRWRQCLPAETIRRAWRLAPCLAPLLTALCLPKIDLRHFGSEDRRGALFRTLTRVMKREVSKQV